MTKKITFTLLLFLLTIYVKGQDLSDKNIYIVNTENLNVRDEPNLNSTVVHQVHLNDTLYVKTLENNWYKIEYSPSFDHFSIGYVHSDFVKKASQIKNTKKVKEEEDLGFKDGFIVFGKICFVLCLVIFSLYYKYSKRTKDSRYSGGYREQEMNFGTIIKFALYSLIISLLFGLIAGIITWIA